MSDSLLVKESLALPLQGQVDLQPIITIDLRKPLSSSHFFKRISARRIVAAAALHALVILRTSLSLVLLSVMAPAVRSFSPFVCRFTTGASV